MALTNTVIMPGADYQAACDVIRAKTGKTALIKSGDLAAEISSIGDERVKYVTFMNGDTELIKYPVITGDTCRNPVSLGLIETPTKEMTESTVYTYSGWSLTDGGSASADALVNVTEDRVVYATYAETIRMYTINFYDGETLLSSQQLAYGETAVPPDTAKEGYTFIGWSSDDFVVTGDKDFYGTWQVMVEDIVAEQTITLSYDSNYGCYSVGLSDVKEDFVTGKTYIVVWDGVVYTCTARDVAYKVDNQYITNFSIASAIGNGAIITKFIGYNATTTESTSDPFFISSTNGKAGIYSSSANSHTVRIYKQ